MFGREALTKMRRTKKTEVFGDTYGRRRERISISILGKGKQALIPRNKSKERRLQRDKAYLDKDFIYVGDWQNCWIVGVMQSM